MKRLTENQKTNPFGPIKSNRFVQNVLERVAHEGHDDDWNYLLSQDSFWSKNKANKASVLASLGRGAVLGKIPVSRVSDYLERFPEIKSPGFISGFHANHIIESISPENELNAIKRNFELVSILDKNLPCFTKPTVGVSVRNPALSLFLTQSESIAYGYSELLPQWLESVEILGRALDAPGSGSLRSDFNYCIISFCSDLTKMLSNLEESEQEAVKNTLSQLYKKVDGPIPLNVFHMDASDLPMLNLLLANANYTTSEIPGISILRLPLFWEATFPENRLNYVNVESSKSSHQYSNYLPSTAVYRFNEGFFDKAGRVALDSDVFFERVGGVLEKAMHSNSFLTLRDSYEADLLDGISQLPDGAFTPTRWSDEFLLAAIVLDFYVNKDFSSLVKNTGIIESMSEKSGLPLPSPEKIDELVEKLLNNERLSLQFNEDKKLREKYSISVKNDGSLFSQFYSAYLNKESSQIKTMESGVSLPKP